MTQPTDPVVNPTPNPAPIPPVPTPEPVPVVLDPASDVKPWWQSKQLWLGVIMTLIGVSTYFSDPLHTPVLSVASISLAIGGVMQIILRVWFTAQPITIFAARKLRESRLRELTRRGM